VEVDVLHWLDKQAPQSPAPSTPPAPPQLQLAAPTAAVAETA
jgi:hypothetical protein